MYSLTGFAEESQWLYVVNFHQKIFNKIRHPGYTRDN